MESPQSFWLIVVNETSSVSVSLVEADSNLQYRSSAFGPETEWNPHDPDSLVSAIDVSLSTAATDAQLAPDSEPGYGAFILSPFWIGPDGKILPQYLKLIENVCHQLDLKPTGFISYDEAIVEAANVKEDYPVSFILTNLSPGILTISLVHLGKIKARLQKNFLGEFESKYLEEALVELNSESALPPEIVVIGHINENVIFDLKNYSWTGKKNIETFLHFPEVKSYDREELSHIFIKTISSPPDVPNSESLPPPTPESKSEPIPEPLSEPEPNLEEETPVPIIDVPSSDLGFTSADSPLEVTKPINIPAVIPRKKISFPKIKIKIPKIHFHLIPILLWPLAFIPLVILAILLTSKADIVLHLTPYQFDRQIKVTLAPDTNLSLDAKTIPVEIKTVEVEVKESINTTGEKIIGEKAKGEVEIYNKLDKTQNLAKGTILTDPSGKKFELLNAVQIASSSSNLNVDPPVIVLGKTKTVVIATDLGPESNIGKDTLLNIKDNSSLITKVTSGLSGGSKETIKAVSAIDRKNLESKITTAATNSVKTKIESELKTQSGLINDSMKVSHERLEYTREVGESADELTASAKSKASVFVLSETTRNSLISTFLADSPNFSQAVIDPTKFNLDFKIDKLAGNTATATLTITGQALPSLDLSALKKQLRGQFIPKARLKITAFHPRIYQTNIISRYPFLGNLNPLPLRSDQLFVTLEP